MHSRDRSTKSALVAVVSTAIIAVTATSALSMPLPGGLGGSARGSLLQRTAADQHRIYPGSESAEAQKSRSERNAPNMFCEKQENKCE